MTKNEKGDVRMIYVMINKEDGRVLLADVDQDSIKKNLYSDRYVEVWDNGNFIKSIDGKDKNNEEAWNVK